MKPEPEGGFPTDFGARGDAVPSREFLDAIDGPHDTHLADMLGYLRPSTCPTCRAAVDVIHQQFPEENREG